MTTQTTTPMAAPPAEHPRPRPARKRMSFGQWFAEIGWRHVVGIVALVFALFPILFILSAAFDKLGTLQSASLIPTNIATDNFSTLLKGTRGPFTTWYGNTLIVCAISAVGQTFLGACSAYAFSRFRFKGRRPSMLAILFIQMFPQFLLIVALFGMISDVNKVFPSIGFNSIYVLSFIYLGGSIGTVWLMKGFFDAIPKELDEAAWIDGAGHARIFFTMILRWVAPILAVTGLLAFVGTINEFIIAPVFLTDTNHKTLAVGLIGLVEGEKNANFGAFAAGAVLTALPAVILFQVLQRYIVGGLTAGAVKG